MGSNWLLSELKRRLRGVGELQQAGSQINVKGKDGMIGGICFITYNVIQLILCTIFYVPLQRLEW
jgi:hypothetical protein